MTPRSRFLSLNASRTKSHETHRSAHSSLRRSFRQRKPRRREAAVRVRGGNNPFSDPARGQERGAAMVADGADRILAAGAGSNGGIFKAMRDAQGVAAFGVDVNQCPQAPGAVMDNVEKKTDVSVELAVKGIVAGSQPPIAALGLKEGGMSVTALDTDVKGSKCLIADYPDAIAKVKALRDQIVDGSIKIADPMSAK
jgi:basic membrane protein A and related proteins